MSVNYTMSKRELSKYLSSLSKKELEAQVVDLYDRLKEVKSFYKFVFHPKEEKILDEAKFKIHKEYFPPNGRKPKQRRSVAQKQIKNFIILGVESELTIDLMLYTIETAQLACGEKKINQDAFYKSMLKSFDEVVKFVSDKDLKSKFKDRIYRIAETAFEQDWFNKYAFEKIIEKNN